MKRTASKPRKRTDTELLNYLEKKIHVSYFYPEVPEYFLWSHKAKETKGKTLRLAIQAAMKSGAK